MFCSVVLGVRQKKSLVDAVDRRCWCGERICLLFFEFVKVLQNYDVWGEAGNFGEVPYLLLAAKMLVSGNIQMMGIWRYKRVRVCPTFLVRICLCDSLNIKHNHYDSNVNNRNDMLRKVLWADLWLRHSMPFMCCLSNEAFAWVLMCFITMHYKTINNCCMAMRDLWC